MNNEYLIIESNSVNYQDNVYSGIMHYDTPEKFFAFCLEQAHEMRTSNLGNYDELTQEQREELARRWENARGLPNGEYNYYFNLEDKRVLFVQSVKEFAESIGIDYELKLKD